jgi:hypothetical protein
MIMFKALGVIAAGKEVIVDPLPNYGREPAHSWDAYGLFFGRVRA